MNQFSLLKYPRFLPIFITQFLGALNDNVFKNAIVILISYTLSNTTSTNNTLLIIFAGGIFILPFFLFSAIAGQLADKFEKSMLIRRIKLAEIAIMVCASIGFYFMNVWLLLAILFLMGTQSTLFGPLKYSILPQHLAAEELLSGNGIVQTATYLSILIGTIMGGLLIAIKPHGNLYVAITIITLAGGGWLASRFIPSAPAAQPTLKISPKLLLETVKIIHYASQQKIIFWAIIAISCFWFYGAAFLSLVPSYTRDILHADEQIATLILASFSIGIGIGSLLCNRLMQRRSRPGPVLLGAIGISCFGAIIGLIPLPEPSLLAAAQLMNASLFLQHPNHWWILLTIALIGISGGLYIVPLYTLVQQQATLKYCARIIAATNISNAFFMVSAAVFLLGLIALGSGIQQLFLMLALINSIAIILVLSKKLG